MLVNSERVWLFEGEVWDTNVGSVTCGSCFNLEGLSDLCVLIGSIVGALDPNDSDVGTLNGCLRL